jgi:hypothetical protein
MDEHKKSPIYPHIFAHMRPPGAMPEGDKGARAMADLLDFREEAKWCLNLAEAETQPEVRTLLMGMVVGWLSLANRTKSPAALQHAPMDDA